MSAWILEPRDTLLVGDGRPIKEASAMRSLDFPWPSTLAGLVRTRIGTDAASGVFKLSVPDAKKITIRGPVLLRLDGEGCELLVPAPRDCMFYEVEDHPEQLCRRRLVPRQPESGLTDLPELALPMIEGGAPTGKAKEGPAFWRWTEYEAWLQAPASLDTRPCETFGYPRLIHEQRTHVAMDPKTGTGADSQLFSTDSLRFSVKPGPARSGRPEALGLFFECDNPDLKEGVALFGGERRPSFLRAAPKLSLPAFPKGLPLGRRLRLVLLTPALFDAGYLPGKGLGENVRIVAACVPRPQSISGWSFETKRPGPKVTRHVAPAGSVYWIELDPGHDPLTWAKERWMTCISDKEQDRLDGFGLCAVGVG